MAQDYARRLARFLDDLGHGAVHLVGHSLGALIAAAFARDVPDRAQSLLLASCANGYGVARGGALPDGVQARLDDLARLGPNAFAATRASNLVHDPVQHPDLVARVEGVMAQINAPGYTQAVRMLASGDLPHDLARVVIRPSFVIGAEDRVTPMVQTTAAAAAWADAHGTGPTITEIAQAGHAVYLQQPTAFCVAFNEHLAAVLTPEGV